MFGKPLAFVETTLTHDSNDCLPWPYARCSSTGYGAIRRNGKTEPAHRIICERAHGSPPTPKHDVAHSCRNRACVNPRHLRWATRSENLLDKVRDDTHRRGMRTWNAKLTEQQVRQIRISTKTHEELAKIYGVTRRCVGKIRARQSWAWL